MGKLQSTKCAFAAGSGFLAGKRDFASNRPDDRFDLTRRRRRGIAQLLDLAGDHGEAPASLSGVRRLDGCVQSEEFCLNCDSLDDLRDLGNLFGSGDELIHRSSERRNGRRDSVDGFGRLTDDVDAVGSGVRHLPGECERLGGTGVDASN